MAIGLNFITTNSGATNALVSLIGESGHWINLTISLLCPVQSSVLGVT